MALDGLNHYFVRARNLARSHHFYCDVLGFEVMKRPDFPYPGYWLGLNGQVQVHMGLVDAAADATPPPSTGAIDHVAFNGSDPESFARRLREAGLPSRERYRSDIGLMQIFVADPDGVMIELNFPGIPARPAWMATAAA
jgi:catechol 2,3-dioxygenase-like lactoylglutathione lyase family enzyme